MSSTQEQKNYRALVNKAEQAFSAGKHLEAFLVQSCVFESVVKGYAFSILDSIFSSSSDLKSRSKNFEMARLTDELFLAGKIKKDLYESLNGYRAKRNKVIHKVLKYKSEKQFEKELKEAYRSGVGMKVFIVEEMVKMRKGKTAAELSAKMERDLGDVLVELPAVLNRELGPKPRKINRQLRKLSKKDSK